MFPTKRPLTQIIFFALLIIFLAACGSKADVTPTPAKASTGSTVAFGSVPTNGEETAVNTPTPSTNVDPLLVTNLDDVRKATVRVASKGSYLDYAEGDTLSLPNHGSGFIIDPSGIAVTNNHVVTGASFLEIWIEGEEKPHNARVLGVSECSDLAVIDIDGDGFPYLDWYEDPISVGQTVYAAGFPLYGNTIYTLTRGVIAKEAADGETSWASVESVLQIDATIQDGNSGRPLVTKDGRSAVSFGSLSGQMDTWKGCGANEMTVLNIATTITASDRMIWLMFMLDAGETAVAEQVFNRIVLLY